MFNIVIKTVIIYVLIIVSIRIMGKKQVGQLQSYELAITILIAEVGATPMASPESPLILGIVPALTLLFLYYLITYISLKSEKVRELLCGKPSLIIYNGQINEKELRRLNYNLNDLLEQIRSSGVSSIADIHYALLETNGSLSVFQYAAKQPLTPEQMGLDIAEHDICTTLVTDAKLHIKGLEHFGISIESFKKILHTCGFSDNTKDILFATLSEDRILFVQDKKGKSKTIDINFLKDVRHG